MVYTSNAPKLRLVGSLDGMRAISFLLVFIVHVTGEKTASFVGSVDVFFVVSGFLISTLIMQEYRSTGGIAFKQFYIRRGLRLLPALYPVLIFALFLGVIVDGGKYLGSAVREVVASFFYVYHVVFAATWGGGTVEGGEEHVNFLTHLWTLSVEEHFYFLIPVILWAAIKKNRVREFAAFAVVFVIFCAYFRFQSEPGPLFFFLYRPDSLMVGVLAAIVNAEMPTELNEKQTALLQRMGILFGAIGSFTLLASTSITNKLGIAFKFTDIEEWNLNTTLGEERFGLTWTQFGFTVVAISVAVVVLALVRCPNWWASPILSIKPLRYVGRRSYTLYIWHIPLLIFFGQALDPDEPMFEFIPPAVIVLVAIVTLAVVTVVSYRYVEKPALKLKMRYSADPDAVDISKG